MNYARLRAGTDYELDPAVWAEEIASGILRPVARPEDEPAPVESRIEVEPDIDPDPEPEPNDEPEPDDDESADDED